MKNKFRILAAFLCICLTLTFSACNRSPAPDESTSTTGDEEPSTPPTNADLLFDALDAYDTYLSNISDIFGASLPAVSDHGISEGTLTLSDFSLFGESQADLIDANKPFMQMTTVLAGEKASAMLSMEPFGEQIRFASYASQTEAIIEYPDLHGIKPMRLFQADSKNETTFSDSLKALLDSLPENNPSSYFNVTEEGNTRVFSAQTTYTQLKEAGIEIDAGIFEQAKYNDIFFQLTEIDGLPTELRLRENAMGATAVEFILTTSYEGNDTKIGASLLQDGESLFSLDCKITALEGAVTVDATLLIHQNEDDPQTDIQMNFNQLDFNLKLLLETDGAVKLSGTIEARANMEGGAAFILPFTVDGRFSAEGETRKTSFEISTSGAGIFSFALRYESSFTPSEVTVTMPSDAVDMDDMDEDALSEALWEAYPLTMQALSGYGDGSQIGMSYQSEDMTVSATVYEDDTIRVVAYASCEDDGERMAFSYGGKSIGAYDYTKNADGSLTAYGMQLELLPDAADYGCEKIFYYTSEDENIWMDIEIYENGEVFIDFCLPFEMTDTGAQILLPDGSALPFEVSLAYSDMGSMMLGSLLLFPYDSIDAI